MREPWERLLSAYYYKVGSSSKKQFYSQWGPEFLKQFSEREAKDRISFSEFLRFIGSSTDGLVNANLHWRPIYLVNHSIIDNNISFIIELVLPYSFVFIDNDLSNHIVREMIISYWKGKPHVFVFLQPVYKKLLFIYCCFPDLVRKCCITWSKRL